MSENQTTPPAGAQTMNYAGAPVPATASDPKVRQWGMLCHLVALVGLLGNGIGFLLGPLVAWLVLRERDPFIDAQGKEAVNFQITMVIATAVCFPLVFVFVGLLLLPAIGVFDVVMVILASLKANQGESYRYPLTIRFLK